MAIEDIYSDIAQHLIAQIDGLWLHCQINMEFFGDAAEFDIVCVKANNEEVDLDAGYSLFKCFKGLHKVTTENPKNNWNRAKFILFPDGEFTIDFKWDQELADEIEKLANED